MSNISMDGKLWGLEDCRDIKNKKNLWVFWKLKTKRNAGVNDLKEGKTEEDKQKSIPLHQFFIKLAWIVE